MGRPKGSKNKTEPEFNEAEYTVGLIDQKIEELDNTIQKLYEARRILDDLIEDEQL